MGIWDAATWWTAAGTIAAVLALAVALLAWLKPGGRARPGQALQVETSNLFPVFEHPDGSSTLGDHFVGVTLRNPTPEPVKVVGWGLLLPGGRSLVQHRPAVRWEPSLPHLVPGRDSATWHFDADELRRTSAHEGVPYKSMRAFVRLADGRQITADKRGVPLAD